MDVLVIWKRNSTNELALHMRAWVRTLHVTHLIDGAFSVPPPLPELNIDHNYDGLVLWSAILFLRLRAVSRQHNCSQKLYTRDCNVLATAFSALAHSRAISGVDGLNRLLETGMFPANSTYIYAACSTDDADESIAKRDSLENMENNVLLSRARCHTRTTSVSVSTPVCT